MSKFLDNTGLATLWANIKTLLSTSLSDFGKKVILSTEKGTANGVAELDESGKVPASQLPSYVDDVLEYASITAFPATGETGKIYVSLSDNKTYRWSGSAYVEIASGVTLGETSSTAYRGDRGKIAYDHSQKTHAPTTPATASAAGLMSAADKQRLDGLQNYTHPAHTALPLPSQTSQHSEYRHKIPPTLLQPLPKLASCRLPTNRNWTVCRTTPTLHIRQKHQDSTK